MGRTSGRTQRRPVQWNRLWPETQVDNSSPTRSCPAWVSHHVPREFSCFKWHRELPGWWGSSLILFSSLYLSISKEPKSMGSNVAKQKLSLPRGKVHVPELMLRSPGASQPLAPLGCPVLTPGSPPTFHTPKPRARSCLWAFAVPCCSMQFPLPEILRPITPSLCSIRPSASSRGQPRLPPVAILPCQAGSRHPGRCF